MNFIQRLQYDDDGALDELAENPLLGSYPHLCIHVPTLKAGYAQYLAVNGDATQVTPVILPDNIADYMRRHYKSPPRALDYIKSIRENSDWNTCPMCGSMHSGTLDHFFDKEQHPAFAIFSPNLVPACKCNSLRDACLTGDCPEERLLHPYFDAILNDRLVAARFADLGETPQVETRIILDHEHPSYAAAKFHHDKIVARTAIVRYLISRWSMLLRRPSLVVPDLKNNPVDHDDLVAKIKDERDRIDGYRGGKNNWDSIMLSGLLDEHVIDWLLNRLLRPERQANSTLL